MLLGAGDGPPSDPSSRLPSGGGAGVLVNGCAVAPRVLTDADWAPDARSRRRGRHIRKPVWVGRDDARPPVGLQVEGRLTKSRRPWAAINAEDENRVLYSDQLLLIDDQVGRNGRNERKRPAMDGLRARVQTDTLSGDGTFKERAGLLDGVGRGSASEH
jgi:hypothetical protein